MGGRSVRRRHPRRVPRAAVGHHRQLRPARAPEREQPGRPYPHESGLRGVADPELRADERPVGRPLQRDRASRSGRRDRGLPAGDMRSSFGFGASSCSTTPAGSSAAACAGGRYQPVSAPLAAGLAKPAVFGTRPLRHPGRRRDPLPLLRRARHPQRRQRPAGRHARRAADARRRRHGGDRPSRRPAHARRAPVRWAASATTLQSGLGALASRRAPSTAEARPARSRARRSRAARRSSSTSPSTVRCTPRRLTSAVTGAEIIGILGIALLLISVLAQRVAHARRNRAFLRAVRDAAAAGGRVEPPGRELAVLAASVNELLDVMTARQLEAQREHDAMDGRAGRGNSRADTRARPGPERARLEAEAEAQRERDRPRPRPRGERRGRDAGPPHERRRRPRGARADRHHPGVLTGASDTIGESADGDAAAAAAAAGAESRRPCRAASACARRPNAAAVGHPRDLRRRRPDPAAGAERRHRGGPRGRARPRVRRRRARGRRAAPRRRRRRRSACWSTSAPSARRARASPAPSRRPARRSPPSAMPPAGSRRPSPPSGRRPSRARRPSPRPPSGWCRSPSGRGAARVALQTPVRAVLVGGRRGRDSDRDRDGQPQHQRRAPARVARGWATGRGQLELLLPGERRPR